MKRMLVNANDNEEVRIAIVEDGVLQELHVELSNRESYLGNLYKGKVVNIEPSIGAAFVNFGGTRNGFLHASDVVPAYANPEVELVDILEGRIRAGAEEGPEALRQLLDDEDSDDEDGNDDEGGDASDAESSFEEETRSYAEEVDGEDDGADDSDDDSDDDPDDDPDDDRDGDSDNEDYPEDVDEDEDPGDDDAEDAGDEDAGDEDRDPIARMAAEPEGQPDRSESGDRKRRRRRRRRNPGEGGTETVGEVETQGTTRAVEGPPPVRGGRSGRKPRIGGGRGRSQPSASRSARRSAPRLPIQELLRKGQEIVVQITKEGIGAKGPTLTTYLSLPGRCLVLMPSLPKCGVSRKLDDPKERRRLKRIVKDLDETGKGGIGFIVRTAGIDKTKADLERDLEYLKTLWSVVVKRAKATRAPAPLYVESDLVLRTMRDFFTPDIDEVVVDSEPVFGRVSDFVEKLMPRFKDRVKHHAGQAPLFHSYGIEASVEDLYLPKVELPGGGSIVIEQTEALVAIDVNSGKFKPGTTLEETAYRTNLDAIDEIVRQLRLRDLGGVIIVDFIDMMEERHRRNVERRYRDALKRDRARINIGRISIFGMLEMTRQRVGPGLKRTVFQVCPTCKGSGLVRTVQSKALAVLREMRALAKLPGFFRLEAYMHPEVFAFLGNWKRREMTAVEEVFGREIQVRAEPSYPVEVVHYRFLDQANREAKVNVPPGLGVKV